MSFQNKYGDFTCITRRMIDAMRGFHKISIIRFIDIRHMLLEIAVNHWKHVLCTRRSGDAQFLYFVFHFGGLHIVEFLKAMI